MSETSPQKSILIVDDTPINIGVISGALKDSFKTKVATNGEKALAIASPLRFYTCLTERVHIE